ncbi:hypothetical protein ABZ619_23915 [Streptomyces sp. NPDC007851]|uniref:hypothetical protein n=1 Tax=Streptomyces sp. NPDC007851 TaxID=3155008 RepID=UPI0033DBA4CF
MERDQQRIEQARAVWEEHVRACRPCAGGGGRCQSAILLRRTYNSLVSAARSDGPPLRESL